MYDQLIEGMFNLNFKCPVSIIFFFFYQERAIVGKMSSWSWHAPNRSAPRQSSVAFVRYTEKSVPYTENVLIT